MQQRGERCGVYDLLDDLNLAVANPGSVDAIGRPLIGEARAGDQLHRGRKPAQHLVRGAGGEKAVARSKPPARQSAIGAPEIHMSLM